MRKGLLFIISWVLLFGIKAQDSANIRRKVYKVNYKSEIPITVSLYALHSYSFSQIRQKPLLDVNRINMLNKNDVWVIDRKALYQSSSQRFRAQNISDWGMGISILLPSLLLVNSSIRKSWLDMVFLYLETQAINTNIYTWGGPIITNRIRPFVYYEEVPLDEKSGSGTTDSFFSGHTSITATASFFTAKVFSDYHPELGAKKWLLFAAALIPPAFVGYQRYRGLKHFPTDIMVGAALGATGGVLNPHLHKIKKKNKSSMSITPFSGQYSGLVFRFKF